MLFNAHRIQLVTAAIQFVVVKLKCRDRDVDTSIHKHLYVYFFSFILLISYKKNALPKVNVPLLLVRELNMVRLIVISWIFVAISSCCCCCFLSLSVNNDINLRGFFHDDALPLLYSYASVLFSVFTCFCGWLIPSVAKAIINRSREK